MPNTVTSTRAGRPADRQELIVQELRSQIVRGSFGPGSRLPTREKIGTQYGAGTNTVQRALDRLKEDGFILSNGRYGTTVAPNPPHLARYGLIFPGIPDVTDNWGSFWSALSREAERIEKETDISLPIYVGVEGSKHNANISRLEEDVLCHRLAGLIFVTFTSQLEESPLLREPGVARVAIANACPYVPAINTDTQTMMSKGAQILAARGATRVAVLTPNRSSLQLKGFAEQLQQLGLENRAYWNHDIPLNNPATAENIVHLLMSLAPENRPDSLLIADDNILEHATRGLLSAGVRPTDQMTVVSHCNFPWPTPTNYPVTRVGFDTREIIRTALSHLRVLQRGGTVDQLTTILPRTESEIANLPILRGNFYS